MSKLFDTLEQIRKNEAAKASGPNTIPVSKSKKKKLTPRTISFIVIPIFLGVVIYVSLPYLSAIVQQNISRLPKQEQSRTTIEPVPKVETKAATPSKPQTVATAKQAKPNTPPTTPAKSSPVSASKPASKSQANSTLQQFVSFNNKGTELISNNQYWEGIRYLNKAAELQPKSVEPLINIGVALSELGLYGPALRYFKKALEIDPNNQTTLDNITLLTEAGLLDMAM